jgi:glycosyltransferase involved in cell wall biosynthesis
LSVVSPCFNEEDNLERFLRAAEDLREWCQQHELRLELIIVDDGSTDASRRMIASYCATASWLKAVFNSRNLGVYRTSYHGLRYCTGQWVVPMFPVDLQDPLDVLIELLEAKRSSTAAAVLGKKIAREESAVMAALRRVFYRIVAGFSSNRIERNVGEFGVLDRWITDECLRRDDYYPFLRGMIANITDDVQTVDYVWRRRTGGRSKHDLLALYEHAINGLVSTGRSFIRPIVVLGFLIGATSFIFALANVAIWLFVPSAFALSGLPTLIVGLFFLMGIVLLVLGLLGEYVYAIHAQVRGADRAIASRLLNIESPQVEGGVTLDSL